MFRSWRWEEDFLFKSSVLILYKKGQPVQICSRGTVFFQNLLQHGFYHIAHVLQQKTERQDVKKVYESMRNFAIRSL